MKLGLFQAPGLVGESYYRTRRSDLRATLIVVFGLCGALYAGAREIMRLVYAIQVDEPAFGLSDLQYEVIKAAALWVIGGALVAWPLGAAWERWHRSRRMRGTLPADP